jgi:hypothetical protein
VNSTTITANLVITNGATLGARNVTVATAGGSATKTAAFSVVATPPTPTLTAISPASHNRGGFGFLMMFTGTNLVTGATVTFNGTGVSSTALLATSPTTATSFVTISNSAAQTSRDVTVANGGGSATLSGAFKVN